MMYAGQANLGNYCLCWEFSLPRIRLCAICGTMVLRHPTRYPALLGMTRLMAAHRNLSPESQQCPFDNCLQT